MSGPEAGIASPEGRVAAEQNEMAVDACEESPQRRLVAAANSSLVSSMRFGIIVECRCAHILFYFHPENRSRPAV
jgi:hypothetical protein